MTQELPPAFLSLDLEHPVWDRFFSVAPLVVIGSRDDRGHDEFYATHRAGPPGSDNRFCFFVPSDCSTARNVVRRRVFTASFLRPDQVVLASLTAAGSADHPLTGEIATLPARHVDAPMVHGAYVLLECRVERVIDGFGASSLVDGSIVAAHLDREARRHSEADDYDLLRRRPVLAFVSPGRIATIGHSDALPRVE